MERDQHTVILEDIYHQFGVMQEGFSGVHKRFDRLDKKVDDNHKEFLEFKDVMIEFRNEMIDFKDGTDSNFKTTFEYLLQIDNGLRSIRTEVEDLKIKLKGKTELSKVILLEKRLVVAEKKLETMMF